MSGVHLTVKESIKLNMMRYFGCSAIDSIELVNPRVPGDVIPGYERIIDVLYNDNQWTVGYDRFNIGAIFSTAGLYAAVIDMGDEKITLEGVYPYLHSRFGLDIPLEDIDLTASSVSEGGAVTFVIKDECHYLTGSLTIRVTNNGIAKYPKPLHEWLLMSDLKNTGTSGLAMKAPFKIVKRDSESWGTLSGGKTPQAFGDGIELPTVGNWTLDFEFMVASVSEYNSVFAATIPAGYVPGTIGFYNGKLYESHITHASHGKAMSPGVSYRHTLTCKNNVVNYYFDGVKVETWNTNAPRTAWRGFRNTGGGDELFAENVSFIRKLRFWNVTVEGVDLDNLFKDKGPVLPNYPKPDHEWLLKGSYDNTGVSALPITNKFKLVDLPSGSWGTLTGGRTPTIIGDGISLARTGDWCVDFEMLAKQTPIRNTIFQSGIADASGNTLMFYANALYMPYGNSSNIHTFVMPVDVPTRHTLRCVGGTISYYMDGILAQTFPNPGTGPWTHFRSTFGETEQMEEDKTYLRNIRFWQNGMSDIEFYYMLENDGYENKPPLHNWPLSGDNSNIGSSPLKPPFAVPLAFGLHTDGTTMANLSAIGNHPIGATIDASGDWTVSGDFIDPNPGLKGLFTDSTMLPYGISTMLYMNKLTTYLSTQYLNNWYTSDATILMKPGKKHNVIMTKRGPSYRMYVDGVMVQRVSATAKVSGAWTHFGAYNGSASLDTGVKFSNLRIYDYGVSIRQAREIANGDKPAVPYPKPDHEWLMNGTNANTGKLTNAFAPAVSYKKIGGKQYATFTSGRFQRFGVNLATKASWAIDIEVLYTALSEYEHFLGGELSGQTGVFKFFNGKVYEAYCKQTGTPPQMTANATTRITLICTNGIVRQYQNGKFASSWPTTALATRSAITGLGSLAGIESSVTPNVFHFRNFRYYDRALSEAERELLLKQ